MKILIVEDTDERIKVFKRKLLNHEVFIAKTAEEAYKILEKESKFDYIFLDHDLTTVNVAASRMMQLLGDNNIRAKYVPFAWVHIQKSPKIAYKNDYSVKD